MGSGVRQVRQWMNFFIAEKYKKTRKIICVVLLALELLWLVALFFMEQDHIGSLQIMIGFFGGAIAILVFVYSNKLKPLSELILCVVIIAALFIINLCWSLGIKRQNLETVNTVMREETKFETNR